MTNDIPKVSLYQDREEAAQRLCESVPIDAFKQSDTVVIGVSAEGVFFADKIAEAIGASFDILLTEPVMAPQNPEVPIAMISETQEVVINKRLAESFGISEDFIYAQVQQCYDEGVLSHLYRYRKGRELVPLQNRPVLLVDECIESGMTMSVALKSVINRGAKDIYIAVPVLDKTVYENIASLCDGIYCPHRIEHYIDVSHYFEQIEKPTFEEIEAIVEKHMQRQEQKTKEKRDETEH